VKFHCACNKIGKLMVMMQQLHGGLHLRTIQTPGAVHPKLR
jgi:hypothetical protein